MSASSTSYVVDDMTTVYSAPGVHAVGQVVEVGADSYRFVKNGATDVATAGYPVTVLATGTPWTVCADVSDGLNDGGFAGVVMADLATGEYGWLKRRGWYHTCTVEGAVAAVGDEVVVGADGGFRAATDNELQRPAGFAGAVLTEAATGVSLYVEAI